MTSRIKIILFFVVLVIPGLLSAVTAKVAFTRAETVQFCGSCHTMTPWIHDVTDPDSDSLAAEHFKRRLIQHDQCYTCHSNYDFLGPLEAKIKGVRHVVSFYIGDNRNIELYDEFPNENCLQCHADGKSFLEDSNHEPIEDVLSGKDRCVECHEQVHGVEQPDADGDEAAGKDDAGQPDGADTDGADTDGAEGAGGEGE